MVNLCVNLCEHEHEHTNLVGFSHNVLFHLQALNDYDKLNVKSMINIVDA